MPHIKTGEHELEFLQALLNSVKNISPLIMQALFDRSLCGCQMAAEVTQYTLVLYR